MTRAEIRVFYEKTLENKPLRAATLYLNSSATPEELTEITNKAFEASAGNPGKFLANFCSNIDSVPVLNITYLYEIYLKDKQLYVYDAAWSWERGSRKTKLLDIKQF